MKKKIFIVCSVLLLGAMLGGIIIFKGIQSNKAESFNLNDEPYYLGAMRDFPSDKILGEIPTAKDAKEKAVSEWLNLFGVKIKDEKPYKVFYDKQNDIWLVKGSLKRGWVGGVAFIIMQKSDGKILAIWHDQ